MISKEEKVNSIRNLAEYKGEEEQMKENKR